MTPIVLVAAIILVDADGRVLLAQRPEGKSMAGLWELPGGKVEPGETPEAALVREIMEEIGLLIAPESLIPFNFASHPYGSFHLLMPVFLCRDWSGEVTAREGQATAWVEIDHLGDYPAPEADIPLFAAIQRWKEKQSDAAGRD